MLLLPNGTVMASDGGTTGVGNGWDLLTPDNTGSYDNGTWSSLAPMSTQRLYDGSVVLPSGQVLVYGGEYSGASGAENEVNSGEVYNIATNTWTPMQTLSAALNPGNTYGDAPLELLPNGNVLGANNASSAADQGADSPTTYIYNPILNSWSAGPTKIDPGVSAWPESTSEESLVKLPGVGGNILDYELWASLDVSPGYGEYLNTATNTWTATGPVPVPLSQDNGASSAETELGPAMLLPTATCFRSAPTARLAPLAPTPPCMIQPPIPGRRAR